MAQLPVVAVCTLIALVLATTWRRYRARMVLLDRIPTVGHSGFFSSYISAYKFLKHGAAIVQEGCDKIPLMDKWIVIISNVDMIEDFYRASESQLSLQEAFRATFHADLVLGKQPGQDPYHVGVIQGTLTRNIGAKFPEIYDELLAAFNDELPPTDGQFAHYQIITIRRRAQS
ncbi:hypothetical protein VNI00_002273 [Paramarasmius palmivorus]|uniref:Cytochrome P450 n=1 Tax=Paramarasmius palmivorus TaxID=297713 RepID=A0AAW0E463_9AGAR